MKLTLTFKSDEPVLHRLEIVHDNSHFTGLIVFFVHRRNNNNNAKLRNSTKKFNLIY